MNKRAPVESFTIFRWTLFAVYVLTCAGAVGTYVAAESQSDLDRLPHFVRDHPTAAFITAMAILVAVPLLDFMFKRKRIEIVSAIYFGVVIGLLLAFLLRLALEPLFAKSPYWNIISLLMVLVLIYLCISLLIQTRDDFRFVIPYIEFAREVKGDKPLIVDSSALIDGRIADVAETKIFDCDIIVPQFVLQEVQEIADSNDKLRRTRGRRGLEILARLQNNPRIEVKMYEIDAKMKDMTGDQRLIEMAKKHNGRLLTNDYNLNKVADVQGIDVVNLNEVANALKPRFIPGDRFKIEIVREGESAGQGVGYLDDGTMVVCEQASQLIGTEIEVVVTSVLQSSAGRMIFVRQS